MGRWIVGIIVVLIVTGGGFYLARHPGLFTKPAEPAKPLPTATAELKDIEQTVSATGEIRPTTATEVKSEVSGQIVKLHVEDGDEVKADQLLVELDRKELESQVAENELQIKGTKLNVDKAQQDFDRNIELISRKMIPQKDYDDSKIALEIAQNQYEIQKARLDTLKQQMAKTEIHAPHAGVVLNLAAKQGTVIVGASSVSSGTVLMQVADLSHLEVRTQINEIDVTKLKEQMKVELTFDSIPGLTMPGHVDFVSPSAGGTSGGNQGYSNQANSSSVRTFPATIVLDGADPRIRPGITATLKIPIAKVQQAVALPIECVFAEQKDVDKRYVYIKKGEKFDRQDVTVGINDAQLVEIKTGLAKGDVVAKERPKDAKEGIETGNFADQDRYGG